MTDTISKKSLIAFRGFHPDDLNFILSGWLQGLYFGNSFFNCIERKAFFENYDPVVKRILADPKTHVQVACLQEDPTVILGYAVLKLPDTLHWIQVKMTWRRIGIMRSLLEPFKLTVCTHLTDTFYEIKPKKMKFNPFAL